MCVQGQLSLLKHLSMAVRFDGWRKAKMAVMTSYTDVGGSLSEVVLSSFYPRLLSLVPPKNGKSLIRGGVSAYAPSRSRHFT
jgi:hypothetical protein